MLLELAALLAVIVSLRLIPQGLLFSSYLVVAEFLATVLIHCPAHYATGALFGVRFTSIKLSRPALVRSFPRFMEPLAPFLLVPTLFVDRPSIEAQGKWKLAAMYSSGVTASVLSAFALAASATQTTPIPLILPAWVFALAFLAFDSVFSPRSGDLMRARRALRSESTQEPLRP